MALLFILPFWAVTRDLSQSARKWEMGNGRGRLVAAFVPKDLRVERHETGRRET